MGEKNMIIDPMWWSWQSELPVSICEAIITEGKKLESTSGKVGGGSDNSEGSVDEKTRKSKVSFFDANNWISAICWKYMEIANRNSGWNFSISGQQSPQFTIYDNDEFYDFHEDSSGFQNDMRKLSMSISITNPDDYEGGNFEFENGIVPDSRLQGSIVVFPSFIKHRVSPVTKGTRYSLVNWFTGERFR